MEFLALEILQGRLGGSFGGTLDGSFSPHIKLLRKLS